MLVFPGLGLQMHITAPGFLHGAADLNSDPYGVWQAGTVLSHLLIPHSIPFFQKANVSCIKN